MSDTQNTTPVRRVLLVDDQPEFTALMKDFLLAHRPGMWTVHTAEGYSSALGCLKEHTVDLVVLDLHMPVMDGLQFLTLLKRSYPGLQVVILTARANPESRNQCLQNGAALYLNKLDVADGFEKIYAALEGVAAPPAADGFRGMLRQVGLPDVLQMECLGRKSSLLEITSGQSTGRIFIQDGSIIHAESGPLQGELALFQILALSGGEFQLKSFTRPPRLTIDGHWESLLMEAARLRDEAVGLALQEAESNHVAVPEVPTMEAFEPKPPAPTKNVEEVVLCSGGEVLYAWQTKEVERRIRLLDILASRSSTLEKILPLGKVDRLEIDSSDTRIMTLLQPERKVFIRLTLKQPAAAATQTATA